jgi:hydrogenase maturation protease
MTWGVAETIADAMLYEGYLLYPYHGSALKNRYRWQFGIVGPRTPTEPDGRQPSRIQTECLIEPGANPMVDVKVRFLQIEARIVERLVHAPDQWATVDALTVAGREHLTWDEATPRDLTVAGVTIGASRTESIHPFEVDGGREVEVIRNDGGEICARVVRERAPLACRLHVAVEPAGELRRLRVEVENATPCTADPETDRPAALRRSLIAAHTLLAVSDGAFVSLLDPPAEAAASAAACENRHTWPVLVGTAPHRNLMLSAPIILYDYPTVAPESPGDLFDGTEIDEILTLRVLTLTGEERRAAVATDPRARRIIERAAALSPAAFARLHGATRHVEPTGTATADQSPWEAFLNPRGTNVDEELEIGGRQVAKGSRVRLCPPPGRRADAMDLFLSGQTATVAAVYRDLENQAHIAVIVDAAGNVDLLESNGRYFYFRPDEIELLETSAARPAVAPRQASHRVLVAGIGNMFLGDDGFGPAVTQRLASRSIPAWAKVEDFGIRGVHLAYELLGASPAYESTIIIDAVSRGGNPGTLYLLEPDVGSTPIEIPDAHTLSVESVLAYLRQIGGTPGRVLIVGCEVESVAPEMGLSDAVASAVDRAAELVMELITAEAT